MPGRDRVGLSNDLGPHGHLPVYGTNAVTTAPMHPLLLLLVIIRELYSVICLFWTVSSYLKSHGNIALTDFK